MAQGTLDIRSFALFSGLSDGDAERLQPHARMLHYPAGGRVFDEGEPVKGFYLVVRGAVKIFKVSPSGSEQVLTVSLQGQTFAEAAVFQGTRFPANAECLQETDLLFIERSAILEQVRHDPELGLRMMAGMALKMRRMVHLVEDLTLRDARGRLCRYLAGLLPENPGKEAGVRLPVSQVLVARLLGITSETLSRTLKGLRDEGLIDQEGRGRIKILDTSRLIDQTGSI